MAVSREVVPVYVAAAEAAGGAVGVEVALMMLAIVPAWRKSWRSQVAVLPYFGVFAVLTVLENRLIPSPACLALRKHPCHHQDLLQWFLPELKRYR